MRSVGLWLFALSVAGLGVLSLLSGDFALNWQPVPVGMPWRTGIAYFSGMVLLVFGLGLLVKPLARLSAIVLTADFLIWLLILRLPRVTSLWNAGDWLGVGETAVLVCGAWALLWTVSEQRGSDFNAALLSSTSQRVVRFLFAVALPLIGISHFVYADVTAGMVPAYLPAHLGFAYFTGAAHIAAGAAVLFAVLPRLAATLEGIMMGLFGLMVWGPRVIAAPMSRFEWTAMLVSLAYSAASLIVAGLFKPQSVSVSEWRFA